MRAIHLAGVFGITLIGISAAWAQSAQEAAIRNYLAQGAIAVPKATGTVIIPASSIARPEDVGRKAHTNTKIFLPSVTTTHPNTIAPNASTSPHPGYLVNNPATLACVYHLVAPTNNCNMDVVTKRAIGGTNLIAIVDAFDAPNAKDDLNVFSTQFGLPLVGNAAFKVYYCTGTTAATCLATNTPPCRGTSSCDPGWEGEASLDVQYAHAMAPSAQIALILAKDNNYSSLMAAEDKAAQLVALSSGGEVSNSWGGPEFSGQSAFDSHFIGTKVVYLFSTGDDPGVEAPSSSNKVVAVGGTSLSRDPGSGDFIGEATWVEEGTGISAYTACPTTGGNGWQQPTCLGGRTTPDVAAIANPETGTWVYISSQMDGQFADGWHVYGGTSLATPVMAGIINNAASHTGGSFATNSAAQLSRMYAAMTTKNQWLDVKQGTCGVSQGYWAKPGFDICSGIGASRNVGGK